MSALTPNEWTSFKSYFTAPHSQEDVTQYDCKKGRKSNFTHFFWNDKAGYAVELWTHCEELSHELLREGTAEQLSNFARNMSHLLNYVVEVNPKFASDERIFDVYSAICFETNNRRYPPEDQLKQNVLNLLGIEPKIHLRPTCWEVFKITEESANRAAVRKAYHSLIVELHPDKLRNDPKAKIKEEAFKLIQTAYVEICKEMKW
jgi:hypothetical protein